VQGFYLSPAVPATEIVAMLMHAFRPDRATDPSPPAA
jgi:hypothetical protein